MAGLLWDALAGFPVPLSTRAMAGTFGGTTSNLVVSFLLYDANRGRAGLSGLTTVLSNSTRDRRVWAAFARGHAHEFSHAFGRLSDEYIEYDIRRDTTSETSNVVATNSCSELPWQHLLVGGAINPDTAELVGAFGQDGLGYRSELWCLMNGTHDNVDFYGGNGTLRSNDRFCNYCRELTAFRAYERMGVVTGFDAWKSDFRTAFFEREGFSVPGTVPQENSVGQSFYEVCQP